MNTANKIPRSEITLEQVVRRILTYGRITRFDEKFLFRAMATETSLSPEEVSMVNQVLDRLHMGLIKIAD